MKKLASYCAPALFVLATGTNATEYPQFSLGGYIMVDHDQFSDLFLEDEQHSNNGTDIRRARLSTKAKLTDHWQSKFQVDIADGKLNIKDAYIQYKAIDWADITVGQQKEPFGLEKLTSSSDTFMIERSMVTQALAPGRSVGVKLDGSPGDFTWSLGYFQDDNTQNSNAVTGRLTWALVDDNDNFVHLGSAFSERQLKGDEFRINETLEVYSSDSLLEGTRLNAQEMSSSSVELMWQYLGVVSMAEWIETDTDDETRGNYHYQGGYYQMSYPLSGKNRRYKAGKLSTIKAKHDWELTWRVSQFALQQENRKAQTLTIGVNYLVSNDLMFKANVIRARHQDDGETFGYDNAFAFRAQYSF
ncbi:OprO/OprP family phosphate-selective porin [Shewanella basaltis]|uniref:OprO/OprP family phosphate-selective porin n=1 Tax=Shewanella basaltis TaxID=472183 RepID=UPI00200F714E|nr:porin [Shewanella basaltis]MCL1113071.1 OprO/OprP family phosphate-selective porin [Shewanella basaltis]